MGLCKCPKRKVTNLFCFEHRVNVCEHCIVKRHPKCVIKSYLDWLQDSDYDPNCPICHQDLTTEQCVRLTCYHVFHWRCLNRVMSSLPMETTAPAGYACPVCQDCVFPAENIVSPVADELRSVLKEVNWARAGLGMPLLPSTLPKPQHLFSSPSPTPPISSNFDTAPSSGRGKAETPPPTGPRPAPEGESVCLDIVQDGGVQSSVGEFGATSRKQLQAALPTSPLLLATAAGNHAEEEDHDENKYKRRSALRFLVRWWRSVTSGRSLKRMSMGQRYLIYGVSAMFILITLLVILTHMSAASRRSSDPMLDPMNNPNIRVQDYAGM